jgi:hypothetical protein
VSSRVPAIALGWARHAMSSALRRTEADDG